MNSYQKLSTRVSQLYDELQDLREDHRQLTETYHLADKALDEVRAQLQAQKTLNRALRQYIAECGLLIQELTQFPERTNIEVIRNRSRS